MCTLHLGSRVGICDISVHLGRLLAKVVNLHLLLWQCWAIVLTHYLENQGQVSAVSVERLPLQVTVGVGGGWGWEVSRVSKLLGQKEQSSAWGHSCVFYRSWDFMKARPAEGNSCFRQIFSVLHFYTS